MNALFLKDLADKTRRGMRGKLERREGGRRLSYGYRVTGVGERAINEPEAAVVRRIFDAYTAAGVSPRAIARMLNREKFLGRAVVPGDRLQLIGNRPRERGTEQRTYIGVIVWNRQRLIKDPDTRKRLARPNPRARTGFESMSPNLRIIDEESLAARQGTAGNVRQEALHARRAGPGICYLAC